MFAQVPSLTLLLAYAVAAGAASAPGGLQAPNAPTRGVTVQWVDAETGYAVQPEPDVSTLLGGASWEDAETADPAAGVGGIRKVRILIDPATPPPELRPERIAELRRPDATVILGFVVDDPSGQPLAGASVRLMPAGIRTWTDERGFFELLAPVSTDADAAASPASLVVQKPGYQGEIRSHLELWPKGDWTYRLRLVPGDGVRDLDERLFRRRATPGETVAEPSVVPWPAVEEGRSASAAAAVDAGTAPGLQAVTSAAGAIRVPRNIRVLQQDGATVDYVSLDTYCRRVLPSEWIASWGSYRGGSNSLNAGAVAIRTYAIGFVNTPRSATYDICGTAACQVYNPALTSSYTDTAVNGTANWVMAGSEGVITSGLTEYSAENNQLGESCGDGFTAPLGGCLYDPVCGGESAYGHGRGLCQWGSARWATGRRMRERKSSDGTPTGFPLRDVCWILHHYYPALTLLQGAPLAVGDSVQARVAVNVRQCPGGTIASGVGCPAIATRSAGARGTIVGGPTRVTADGNGYTWYLVQWSGVTGWSVENYLERVVVLPGAPSGLMAAAVGHDRIDLEWTDTTEAETGQELERAPAADGPWLAFATIDADVTGYADRGLPAGSTWFYRVRAFNAAGRTSFAGPASATTAGIPPVLSAVSNRVVMEGTRLGFTNSAVAPESVVRILDFEGFASETANGIVMFRDPRFSPTTRSYLDLAPNLAAVTDTFPPGEHNTGQVLRMTCSFACVEGAWLRLTTAGAAALPNPVLDLRQRLRFDLCADRAVGVALGCRESSVPAGTAPGADGGGTGPIEWVGVAGVVGGSPVPVRTVAGGIWTTLTFDLSNEPIVSFSGGNSVLSTASGMGVLEHVVLVPAAGAGTYNVWFDNFEVLVPKVLTYSLGPGAPSGASVEPTTGVMTWTPSEAQGPGVYPFTLSVTDRSMPPLSDSRTFDVQVLEANQAPALAVIGDCAVHAGQRVTLFCGASDADLPPNLLTFSLGDGGPLRAVIGRLDGLFTWSTDQHDAGSTSVVTIRVTDDGEPVMSAIGSFSVTVYPRPTCTGLLGDDGRFVLTWSAVPGSRYHVQYTDDLTTPAWKELGTDIVASGPTAAWADPLSSERRFYRVIVVE